MERIEVLIDKLSEQKQQHANIEQMLVTVQLLYKEMLNQQQRNASSSTAKVTVMMPNAINPSLMKEQQEVAEEPKVETPKIKIEEPAVVEAKQPEPPVPQKPVEPYQIPKPVIQENPVPKPEVKPEPKPYEIAHPPFDPVAEMPTLIQHQPKKEVHELVIENTPSLNDKLKQEKTELGQVLKETPIKDLRKAIGINDKFLFVNELFRGDEAAYERSIKTINNFHILPEAEYWINRELKVKLGWNDNKDVVQHFYQLVRRRFS